MRIGVVIPTFDRFAESDAFRRLIQAVEMHGFDSAWFGDHIVFPADRPVYMGDSWLDAVTCAAVGVGMTTRLKFGTDVLVAPYRHPLLLAKMAITASRLSGGRFLLGLGIGWLEGEFRALQTSPFSARAEVTEEYLQVLRMTFDQAGELSYDGQWVQFDGVLVEPKPAPGGLPLLVGGNHANALRRAALLGDGWHPLFLTPDAYASGRAEIERIRAEKGVTRPFIFSMSGSEARILADTEAAQRTRVATESASYAPAVGLDDTGRQRFIGTAAQVRDDCIAFAGVGVEQLVLRFAVPNDPVTDLDMHLAQLELFARHVLPHLAPKE
jgi:probable F420-dependent oxidoreductase